MKKLFFLAAVATITLASCMNDELVIADAQPADNDNGMTPILFNSLGRGMTRADFEGADAALKLGKQFVVFGYKGSKTGTPGLATNGIAGGTVFDNYLVTYKENTANTTESNSDNWEYVGNNPIKHAVDNHITQQTIKYWDYSQSQYDFIAWSTGSKAAIYEGTPTTGKVLVSAIKATPATSPATGLAEAYTFEGTAEDLKECYISDLVTVYKGAAGGTYNVVSNGYQQPVTLKFRQLGTKVRIGIYETVPGYSVRDVKFYYGASDDFVKNGDPKPEDTGTFASVTEADNYNASAKIFTTVANGIYKEGKYTVYFPTVDAPTNADNNQAHIEFDPGSAAQKKIVEWDGLNYTIRESGESSEDAIYLGRTSNTASFAGEAADNYYKVYLPNQNGTNLNLRVDYTLESIDGSSEKINVRGATAQVPSIYTQWKPGYAYTYLFKISDKTNGHTGVYDPTKPDDTSVNSDPAGLYPITFDAIVVNAEDKDYTQETITLISTPSITTYQNGSKVVNNNEYTVLPADPTKGITGEIYVTVNDADAATYAVVDPAPATGTSVANYYTKVGENYIPCAADAKAVDGTTYYKKIEPALPNGTLATLTGKAALYEVAAGTTEAEVIDALQMPDDDHDAGTIKGRNKKVLTESVAPNALSLTNEVTYGADGNTIKVSTNQAAKFIPKAATTYAFVYTKTAATGTSTDCFEARAFNDFASGETKYRYKYKSTETTHTVGLDDYYDAQKGVKYYTIDGNNSELITPFIGQDVSNMYLDNLGTTIASGYAVSGVDYYYTVNGGQSYIKAVNVPIASFASAEDIGTGNTDGSWTVRNTAMPANNTAYYKRTGTPGNYTYTYCVFLPQQMDGKYVLDENKANCVVAGDDSAVAGQTYFDKYTKNNGVYYAKVIKVQ